MTGGTCALRELNRTPTICHFQSCSLRILNYLPAKKKKSFVEEVVEDMSVSSMLFFLWVRSPHSRKNPHICYTNMACGTKNKTHTDESRHVER